MKREDINKLKYSEKVISAFMNYNKDSEIAEVTGLSPRTIYRYRRDPELQKCISERRTEYISVAVDKMQASLAEVTDILLEIIRDKETPTGTKVNAINVMFSQTRDWTRTSGTVMTALEIIESLGLTNEGSV